MQAALPLIQKYTVWSDHTIDAPAEDAAGVGQGFWAEYWWLLPPPSCKLPVNLPRSALETLREIDAPLADALLSHRARQDPTSSRRARTGSTASL